MSKAMRQPLPKHRSAAFVEVRRSRSTLGPRRSVHARGADDGRSHIASLREDTLARCRPLTPDDLTAAERLEAETLADDLIQAGGLGHFVIGLMLTWNDLTDRDRLMAAWCWRCAAVRQQVVSEAA